MGRSVRVLTLDARACLGGQDAVSGVQRPRAAPLQRRGRGGRERACAHLRQQVHKAAVCLPRRASQPLALLSNLLDW